MQLPAFYSYLLTYSYSYRLQRSLDLRRNKMFHFYFFSFANQVHFHFRRKMKEKKKEEGERHWENTKDFLQEVTQWWPSPERIKKPFDFQRRWATSTEGTQGRHTILFLAPCRFQTQSVLCDKYIPRFWMEKTKVFSTVLASFRG